MWPLPENPDVLSPDVVADAQHAAASIERFVQGALFYEDPEDVAIKACTVSEGKPYVEDDLRSEDELSKYLATLNTEPRTSRTFIVGQESSRGPLDATSTAFQALLGSVNAFPAVTKIVDAFTPDLGSDYYTGRGGVHFSPAYAHKDSKVLESCSLLKFVEQNGRDEGVFGFSIRQMGVYQNFNLEKQSETCIFINPSVELWRRLKAHSQSGGRPWEHWTKTPLLAFKSLAAGWAKYVGALHDAVGKTMNDAAFYKPEGALRVVDTETLKNSAVFKDRLQHASHVLQNNRETLWAIFEESRNRQLQLQDSAEAEYQAFQRGIEDTMRELQFIHNQVKLITQRLDQTASSFRDVATIENSNFMGQMTAKSIVEAQAVRIIALVTLLLLPPTVTTSFLQMGFIHDIQYRNGTLSLKADPGLLLWLVITLPLMALTIGIWFFWDFKTKRNLRQKQDYMV